MIGCFFTKSSVAVDVSTPKQWAVFILGLSVPDQSALANQVLPPSHYIEGDQYDTFLETLITNNIVIRNFYHFKTLDKIVIQRAANGYTNINNIMILVYAANEFDIPRYQELAISISARVPRIVKFFTDNVALNKNQPDVVLVREVDSFQDFYRKVFPMKALEKMEVMEDEEEKDQFCMVM